MFSNTKQNKSLEPAPMEKIADAFSKKITGSGNRLLVLSFTNADGKENSLGNIFAEKLTTELVKKGNFIVLDRMLYLKKLQENQLSMSSGNTLSDIRKIGEILELKAVVSGIITTYNSGYGLNCRLIDPKTGLIISAEESFYAGE
jgi:TolB-like protein